MRKIWAYGTIRKGSYNHHMIGHIDPLETRRLNGYKMFIEPYNYPRVIPSDNPDDSIVVELFEIYETEWDNLNILETNFGYQPHEIEGATIWVYENDIHPDETQCEHGDFMEWVKSKTY